ncbi:hypothetical protein [Streptomyces sp. NRRL B-24484]|uniref:hypothetical protein n=1 Tax=Streptomyces sp. NRRL B-24484 TaxID=1463833 RepID=UPI0013318D69|nr:hypothetical protein [Streptomyces sp. NRRL B-24484]
MTDNPDGRVLPFPGTSTPTIPRHADTARRPEPPREAPEIPAIPQPAPPESFLRSEGIPARPSVPEEESAGEAEYEESGEYEYRERLSLAEIISQYLQSVVDRIRAQSDEEAPYREAMVADRVARLNAQTERETSLLAQQNKLRMAEVDARGAQLAGRGKGGESGKGLGKGSQQSPAGSGRNGRPGGLGGGTGGGAGAGGKSGGPQGSGTDRGSRTNGPGRGSGGPSGGLGGGSRGSDRSGAPNGRSGAGSGSGGSKGSGGLGGGGNAPASSASERARARNERRAARQAADLGDRAKDRDQKRQNRQREADDTFEERKRRRDEKRARRESGADTGDTTVVGAIRRKLKRSRGSAEGDNGSAGSASKPDKADSKVGDPALKVGDKASKDGAADSKADDPASKDRAPEAGSWIKGFKEFLEQRAKRDAENDKEDDKEDEKDSRGPEADGWIRGLKDFLDKQAAQDAKDADAGEEEGGEKEPDVQGWLKGLKDLVDKQATEEGEDEDGSWIKGLKDFLDKNVGQDGQDGAAAEPPPEDTEASWVFGGSSTSDPWSPEWLAFLKNLYDTTPQWNPDPEPETVTFGRAEQPAREAEPGDDGIVDAEIVQDEAPAPRTGPLQALGPAIEREQRFKRPGTTRPDPSTTEPPMTRTPASPAVPGQRMAKQHSTNITMDEYLVAMVNSARNSITDHESVTAAVETLNALAMQLREMCQDLLGDHNISPKVTRLVESLSKLADECAAQARILSEMSQKAADAAELAAHSVAQVYGEDKEAMKDGGLEQASAAVHHT